VHACQRILKFEVFIIFLFFRCFFYATGGGGVGRWGVGMRGKMGLYPLVRLVPTGTKGPVWTGTKACLPMFLREPGLMWALVVDQSVWGLKGCMKVFFSTSVLPLEFWWHNVRAPKQPRRHSRRCVLRYKDHAFGTWPAPAGCNTDDSYR
jgi:hypothetical protein